MCGINGIFAYHYAANPVDRDEVIRTRDHMIARGPDGCGQWFAEDGRVGLGHRRLSIIDLSDSGAQPMISSDAHYVVTFNGEIYNYRELRQRLETKGSVFNTQSDTEVLLHLFRERGDEMVHDLRGMFAFSIWDNIRRRLFLARDPYGIKPLYYADDGWTFRFASQVKALLAGEAISRDPDPAGVTGFHLLGSVPEPFTTLRAIRCLPAGSTMTVDRTGSSSPKRYHSIASVFANAENVSGPVHTSDHAHAALRDSVRAHLVADVPVGAFLSAGVDSGALVALMRDAGATKIKTITVGFEEFRGSSSDETSLARNVAMRYGTEHAEHIVTRSEFEADLPRIFAAMDQPTIDGINTWFVSKAARQHGLKVAISGLGGDELLGGYPSFQDIPRWVRSLSLLGSVPLLGRGTRALLNPVVKRFGINPKGAGLLQLGGTYAGAYLLKRGLYMPWELNGVLDAEFASHGLRRLSVQRLIGRELQPAPRSPFARVATLESCLYMRNQLLRDTDWASMAHGLEVRVPLVDSILLAQLAPYRGNFGGITGKRLLASAPTLPLPEALVTREKTGFTTPVESWMRSLAGAYCGDTSARTDRKAPWARDWSQTVSRSLALAQ